MATPSREQPFWGFGCNTPFHFFLELGNVLIARQKLPHASAYPSFQEVASPGPPLHGGLSGRLPSLPTVWNQLWSKQVCRHTPPSPSTLGQVWTKRVTQRDWQHPQFPHCRPPNTHRHGGISCLLAPGGVWGLSIVRWALRLDNRVSEVQ